MSKATEIYVLNRAVRLLQPESGFRTSLDSVMLAAACPAKPGDHILDMGCGVGGAGFCVLHRVPDTHLTGVEIQPAYADLAIQNITLNNAQSRAQIIRTDIRNFTPATRFDHIICNPPYFEAGAHTSAEEDGKATALGHREEAIDITTWIDAAFTHLKSRGTLTLIHKADMTDRIIRAFGKRFGGITLIPLWSRTGQPAKRVIIRATKDSKSPAHLHPGLTLHEADGRYTPEAENILRHGHHLP